MKEILEKAKEMSTKELYDLITQLDIEYRAKKQMEDRIGVLAFNSGDRVFLTKGANKLPRGAEGTVIKVMVTRILVDFDRFGRWNVYPDCIQKKEG